jgi:hypothetical protein
VQTADFEQGQNLGDWTFEWFDVSMSITPSGGHPGALMRVNFCCDAFAPRLHTIGSSVFTGDYRADGGVISLGADFRVYTLDPQAFPVSLRLLTDAGTPADTSDDFAAYFAGTPAHTLPPAVAGPSGQWKTLHFDVPALASSLPAGWVYHAADPLFGTVPESADWNVLIQNVTGVFFEYGPVIPYWPIHLWNLGVDNITIGRGAVDAWLDLGQAKGGVSGLPQLAGSGLLSSESFNQLGLTNAAPGAALNLVVGLDQFNAPFKGGVLVPSPLLILLLGTSSSGALDLSFVLPVVPPGLTLYMQAWIQDAAATAGLAASNGLAGVAQ